MNRTETDTIEDIKDVMASTGCAEDDAIALIRAQDRAAEKYMSDEIARIKTRVDSGYYDSTNGLRPDVVFVDRDGDVAISYPGGPDWMGWEQKVAKGI